MSKSLSIVLIVIAGTFLCVLAFGTGLVVGRTTSGWAGFSPFTMMGRNFEQGYSILRDGRNRMDWGGMMGNNRNMMGGYFNESTLDADPLTIDQTNQLIEKYLKDLGNSDLELKEIMIFDNNAYARIGEKSTGIGAMELLVDPVSKAVFPEFGPNMMWNLKYGHMSGMMGRGGMMGGYQNYPGTVDATMTVTPEEALQTAQKYLDQEFPGYETAEDAEAFYGYYTIDIVKDGKPTGMLSVHGFSGEVFFHSWHGTFIEMYE